jgi:GTP-binding protein EngB required for normal cell division
LVDLPGYGFAYAKEEIKDAWDDLVKEYVTTRKGLKRVCMLVDARWGLKPRDEELLYLMDKYEPQFSLSFCEYFQIIKVPAEF